uniref:Caudal type homeobox 2 n=1 Tax=Myotis lucifugus TaxID=59463 RepID=G1Q2I1_MYOLU
PVRVDAEAGAAVPRKPSENQDERQIPGGVHGPSAWSWRRSFTTVVTSPSGGKPSWPPPWGCRRGRLKFGFRTAERR